MDVRPRLYTELASLWPLVSPPEDYEEEVASFRTLLLRHGVPDGARLLHLGCGGGSLDWHLKRHYRVTAVDISPEMLAVARRLNPEVEYQVGDIRDVRTGEHFAAVLLHDAAAYMTTPAELRAAYETAAAHLAPGGLLITPPEELRSHFRQGSVRSETHEANGLHVTTVTVDYDPDPADSWFETTFVLLIRREGHPVQVETDTHRAGLYDLEEVLQLLREAGFEPEVEPWELPDFAPGEDYPLIVAQLRGRAPDQVR